MIRELEWRHPNNALLIEVAKPLRIDWQKRMPVPGGKGNLLIG
jgi:hypothetical protein